MLRPLLASLLLLLAACASPTPDRTLRVDRDMGGFYLERITEMAEITLSDQTIEIRGTCASACTLYLGMPDRTCVHPRARLGFHGPQAYRNGRQQAVPEPFRSEVVQTIAAHYPPGLSGLVSGTRRPRIRGRGLDERARGHRARRHPLPLTPEPFMDLVYAIDTSGPLVGRLSQMHADGLLTPAPDGRGLVAQLDAPGWQPWARHIQHLNADHLALRVPAHTRAQAIGGTPQRDPVLLGTRAGHTATFVPALFWAHLGRIPLAAASAAMAAHAHLAITPKRRGDVGVCPFWALPARRTFADADTPWLGPLSDLAIGTALDLAQAHVIDTTARVRVLVFLRPLITTRWPSAWPEINLEINGAPLSTFQHMHAHPHPFHHAAERLLTALGASPADFHDLSRRDQVSVMAGDHHAVSLHTLTAHQRLRAQAAIQAARLPHPA